ncbi:MAG: DNA polymerase domain-containing protein, partial [Spirochaetota bacterium]
LERLRAEEPALFCEYCLRDSELVLRILDRTGLAALTAKRAALTGLSLDLAWTSIPAFERVYDAALRERRVVPPARNIRSVSGAAGGTVLDPRAGLFEAVLVFDFRSLYPSLMRTFNIDPLTHARAEMAAGGEGGNLIMAPNGARFTREGGILPAVIARYTALREAALEAGDETGAYVYKILMNSFYGVLGAEGCRYARSELAGAITSFARKYLTFARDFFEERGLRVLYGDTDSVFVESGLGASAGFEALSQLGETSATDLNAEVASAIGADYDLTSFLRIRCEKVYARLFIPELRFDLGTGARGAIVRRAAAPGDEDDGTEGAGEARGRAKGYAGLRLAGKGCSEVEVKGMEAARSDGTPLGRRFQTELLALVFGAGSCGLRAAGKDEVEAWSRRLLAELRGGVLDDELVYRRMLRRPVSEYGSENPAVRAARILGWTDRRGRISWVMTKAGAEPPEKRSGAPLDYEHYIEHQLWPIARAVTDEAGWDAWSWFADRPQMELGF